MCIDGKTESSVFFITLFKCERIFVCRPPYTIFLNLLLENRGKVDIIMMYMVTVNFFFICCKNHRLKVNQFCNTSRNIFPMQGRRLLLQPTRTFLRRLPDLADYEYSQHKQQRYYYYSQHKHHCYCIIIANTNEHHHYYHS